MKFQLQAYETYSLLICVGLQRDWRERNKERRVTCKICHFRSLSIVLNFLMKLCHLDIALLEPVIVVAEDEAKASNTVSSYWWFKEISGWISLLCPCDHSKYYLHGYVLCFSWLQQKFWVQRFWVKAFRCKKMGYEIMLCVSVAPPDYCVQFWVL